MIIYLLTIPFTKHYATRRFFNVYGQENDDIKIYTYSFVSSLDNVGCNNNVITIHNDAATAV